MEPSDHRPVQHVLGCSPGRIRTRRPSQDGSVRGGAGTDVGRKKTMLDSGLVEWTLLHSMPRIRDINFVSCCLKAGFPGTVMTRGGLGLHGQVS